MLQLPVTLGELWPAKAMLAARADDDSLGWLPQAPGWSDRSSAGPVCYAGSAAIVCHEGGVTPAALQLLASVGFRLPDEIIPYHDFAQMRRLVADQVRCGRRIAISYPGRALLAPAEAYVTHPDTIADLNDKASLATLLPAGGAPERRIVATAELPRALRSHRRGLPVVLKASTPLGNGGGVDVAICRTEEELKAGCERMATAERVVIERFYEFDRTWCLHFAASERGVAYCGAARQICDDAGTYHGNWCERDGGPGEEAIALGRHAALAGRALGYRGFLGVDVGRTADGRWLAFDLNFRNNGSTLQVLLRDTIADAWGAVTTRVCHGVTFDGTFDEMVEQLWTFNRRRKLVPSLAFDSVRLGHADARPVCNVLLTGVSAEAVGGVVEELEEAGFGMDRGCA